MRLLITILTSFVLLADCSDDTTASDSGADSSTGDTGAGDTSVVDSSRDDTGPGDTGPGDTGPGDTGPGDTGAADTSTSDTGMGDASAACDVAGTYDIVWTAVAGNDASCSPPPAVSEILADGFTVMTTRDLCTRAGCTVDNCTISPVGDVCIASAMASSPCGGLPVGWAVGGEFDYTGSVVTTSSTADQGFGPCRYTGVATRR